MFAGRILGQGSAPHHQQSRDFGLARADPAPKVGGAGGV
jgi:hypothetical protein